jgi:hypothetical protein
MDFKNYHLDIDPVLTNIALGYKMPGMIAESVFPAVPVLERSGTITKFGVEGFKIYDTLRAENADPKRVTEGWTKDTYACNEHSLESPIDYRALQIAQKSGADAILKLETRRQTLAENGLFLSREKEVADMALTAANYAAGSKVTLTGNDQWNSGHADSSPISDVKTGKDKLALIIGVEPNTLTMGWDAWNTLRYHPELQAALSDNERKTALSVEQVASVLGVQYINVGQATGDTGSGTRARLWTDNVLLHYSPMPGELPEGVPVVGALFQEEGFPVVKKFSNKSTLDIMVYRSWVAKSLNPAFGYLIADVNA